VGRRLTRRAGIAPSADRVGAFFFTSAEIFSECADPFMKTSS